MHPAYVDRPVERATLEEIFNIASRAPSGVNTQPWELAVSASRAPALAYCLIDRRLGLGSQLDYGMFVEALRIAAAARGLLATLVEQPEAERAAQAAQLVLPENMKLLCAVQVGYPSDPATLAPAPVAPAAVSWLE